MALEDAIEDAPPPSEPLSQRAAITRAAVEIMAESGIEALSMRLLGQRLGVSPMMPYRHFASKEALFVEMKRFVFTHFGDHIEEYVAGNDIPEESFRKACRGYIDWGLRYPAHYDFVFGCWSDSAYRAVLEADGPGSLTMTRGWAVLLGAVGGVAPPSRDERDNSVMAHLVWQSLHGLLGLHLAKKLSFGFTLDELTEPIIDKLLFLAASDTPR